MFPNIPGLDNGTTAWAKGILDIEKDGTNEIIFTVFTNSAYQPRGVYAYDYLNQELKWKFLTGTQVVDIFIEDIDRDGMEEIILSSASPCNGRYMVNGTNDSHVYIIILDNNGKTKIMRKIGEYCQDMIIVPKDLDHDGSFEAVVIKKSRTVDEKSIFQNIGLPPEPV